MEMQAVAVEVACGGRSSRLEFNRVRRDRLQRKTNQNLKTCGHTQQLTHEIYLRTKTSSAGPLSAFYLFICLTFFPFDMLPFDIISNNL